MIIWSLLVAIDLSSGQEFDHILSIVYDYKSFYNNTNKTHSSPALRPKIGLK